MTETAWAGTADRPWRVRFRAAALPAAAGAAVMAASLVNFLNHNRYPLLSPEIGVVAALLFLGVLLITFAYVLGGRIVRTVLQILLVYVALDLNFDGLAVPLAAVGIALVLQRHAMPFIAVAASVVLVTVLADMSFAERSRDGGAPLAESGHRSGLPVIVHLVLDEHIGVEGLLGDSPEAAAMSEALKQFYLGKGFRLLGGAYSEHMRTVNALPRLFNFGAEQPWIPGNRGRTALSSNAYFDGLGEAGYRISVLQTDYIDYCNNRFVVHCHTRPAAELASVAAAPLTVLEKSEIVAIEFAKLSDVLLVPAALYRGMHDASRVHVIPPVGPLKTVRGLADVIRDATPGSVFFVHELLPHTPYVLDRDCRFKERAEWRDQTMGPRDERMRAYLDQMACLNKTLEAVFEAAGPDAVIVVHGDHGSRITNVEPGENTVGVFRDLDLVAGHSTLFAVRAPAIEPGYDARALPITEILHQLARSGFRTADVSLAQDFVPSVVLEGADWKPAQRHPLPPNWPTGTRH